MEEKKTGLVWMVKAGNFTLNEKTELVKRRIYRGDENYLVKESFYSVDFICPFDLFWYLFISVSVLIFAIFHCLARPCRYLL